VLYIAQWHDIPFEFLRDELRLCFYDAPVMLRKIDALNPDTSSPASCAAAVQRLMVEYRTQRLVVILDQAYDTTVEGTANSVFGFFPNSSFNIRVVFASSPKFNLQGHYLYHDPRRAIVVPFMAALTPQECISIVLSKDDPAFKSKETAWSAVSYSMCFVTRLHLLRV